MAKARGLTLSVKPSTAARPAPDAGPDSWFDYVYLRENPRGGSEEYWHHTAGCRRWLVVCRDTVTHEVRASRDAAAAKGQAA